MDEGTNGDVGHGKGVAGLDVGIFAASHFVAHFQAVGSQDVAFFAILILHQGDMGGTVGVILQGQNGGVHANFIPLEVDNAVFGAVSAAAVTDGNAAVAVASGLFLHRLQEASLRSNFGKAGIIGYGHLAPAGGHSAVRLDSH